MDKIGKGAFARHKALKTHVPGQLAPPGRLMDSSDNSTGIPLAPGSAMKGVGIADFSKARVTVQPTRLPASRIAALSSAVSPAWRDEKLRTTAVPPSELLAGTLVKVFSER